MKCTYFGTTKKEEEARIKELWKKSLLGFIIVGIFMVVANGEPLTFFYGIVPFFFVWGFQACFSSVGGLISFITDLIPIEMLKYLAKFLAFAFFGVYVGIFYFILGNIKLYRIMNGKG